MSSEEDYQGRSLIEQYSPDEKLRHRQIARTNRLQEINMNAREEELRRMHKQGSKASQAKELGSKTNNKVTSTVAKIMHL